MISKNKLREAVDSDIATFIDEEYITKDCFELEFEYEGIRFTISAHGQERWLMDGDEFITILNK